MSSQYGELRPTNSWDFLASLGHPCKFQRVSRLGSVTARHSSSGRQPNVVALNRGRHLYLAGRPSVLILMSGWQEGHLACKIPSPEAFLQNRWITQGEPFDQLHLQKLLFNTSSSSSSSSSSRSSSSTSSSSYGHRELCVLHTTSKKDNNIQL